MKYVPLIWSGIWRKPVRTTLILLQIVVAFALFGVLQGMKTGMGHVFASLRPDLLEVSSSLDNAPPLPVAYANRIRSIPGVKTVTFADGLFGTYQRPSQQLTVMGLEKNDVWETVFPYFVTISPKDLHALQKTRTGLLITRYEAQKFGWRVGERIPITSSTRQNGGSGTWVFDIVGFANAKALDNDIFANYDYLDAARAMDKGTVVGIFVVVSDPKQATAVSATIDRIFANSAHETRTAPIRVMAQQLTRRAGNLNFVIRSVVSAVLVALMFSIGTMMMQTVRERTPELALLKTVGFTNRAVSLLVAVEALILCMAGALIGLGLAMSIFPLATKYVPGLSMPGVVLAVGLVGAVLISLISVSLPASRAGKLQVVDALARR